MKRPILAAALSALGSTGAAVALIAATGGTSLARALSVESAAPASALQPEAAPPPAPATEAAPAPKPEAAEADVRIKNVKVPPPPALTDDPPSAEKTPRPKRAEWKSAPLVRLARSTESRCEAKRIREWILIRCEIWGAEGLSLIAGTRDGLDVWTNTTDPSEAAISIEFPMRRGDRRVFQVNARAGKYGSAPAVLLSERWSEKDPAPLLSVLAAF